MKISSISNVLLDFGESHFESRVPEDLEIARKRIRAIFEEEE